MTKEPDQIEDDEALSAEEQKQLDDMRGVLKEPDPQTDPETDPPKEEAATDEAAPDEEPKDEERHPPQDIPYGRFKETRDQLKAEREEKTQLRAQFDRLMGMVENARKEPEPEKNSPDQAPILDPNHPDFDVYKALGYYGERDRRVDELQRQFQERAEQEQTQDAATQLKQALSYKEREFAQEHPDYFQRVQGYMRDEVSRRSAIHGIPPQAAAQQVQHELLRFAAESVQNNRDPIRHFYDTFVNFAPKGEPPANGAGQQPPQPPTQGQPAPKPPETTQDAFMSLSEAGSANGAGKGRMSLEALADMDEDEFEQKVDVDKLRAMLRG